MRFSWLYCCNITLTFGGLNTFNKETSSVTKTKVLIVEDETAIREMVAYALMKANFDVFEAEDAKSAYTMIADNNPDLCILDWMLPGQSGIEIARRLRRESSTQNIPIIMLTAKSSEPDRVSGLDAGADDYIVKPFSPKELVARINALLRRTNPHSKDEIFEAGGLRLDIGNHTISLDDKMISLGPTEFKLLHFFMTHKNRVYSRAQLLDQVWGHNNFVEERTVDVHIVRLRKALDKKHAGYLQTVRGAGYRFSNQPQ